MERLRDLIAYLKDAADHAEERIEAVISEYPEIKPPRPDVTLGVDDESEDDLLDHDGQLQERSVARVERTIVHAIQSRASDIHFENEPGEVRIRIRVDGDLRCVLPGEIAFEGEIDRAELQRMVRIIKVRAGINIADARLAHGGQFRTVVGGQVWYVRVQTQPTIRGENVVMRLLSESSSLQAVSDLGFFPDTAARYQRLLENPGGLVLVVGPTGSGKTTTLYAGLRELALDERRKVISIEDPVEYRCRGVQQVETCREMGFGFADAMRAFVRQDPDVILLGEIRDPESALEAIRASQTGHLVLSTLHCNDSVDAVQRLLDLGMLANSISSELLAVFAQRLAKRICVDCREETEADPKVLGEVFPDGPPEGFRAWTGRGCDACEGRGTLGRIAVVEELPIDPRMRDAFARGSTLEELRAVARESGIVSLRDRALELAQAGVIEFDGLPQFIPVDRLVPPPA